MEKSYKNIYNALKYYIPVKYWNLNNWDIIIKREEEIEENVFQYKCSFFTLYFDNELRPLDYKNQHIIEDKLYYDTSDDGYDALAYVLLGYVDWYKHY